MSLPRVLLLGGTLDAHCVGEMYLRQLCKHYPGFLARYALTTNPFSTLPDSWLGFPLEAFHLPREHGAFRLGRASRWPSGAVLHEGLRHLLSPVLVRRIADFGRSHRVDLVWAVLNGPLAIYLSHRVAQALGAPLVGTIWDPPESFVEQKGLDPWSADRLMVEYRKALARGTRFGMASQGMADDYAARYGAVGKSMILGIEPDNLKPLPQDYTDDHRFVIGFAGNVYAKNEFRLLLKTLAATRWRVAGKDVVLRMMGPGINQQAVGPMRLEYRGFQSLEDTIDILAGCDISYVPYWFDPAYRYSTRVCFPGKISTSLAAGRPVLFHGPKEASPTAFLAHWPAGRCCHSLEERDLLDALKAMAGDRDAYLAMAAAGRLAITEELSQAVFLERFAWLIGIDPASLLTDPRPEDFRGITP